MKTLMTAALIALSFATSANAMVTGKMVVTTQIHAQTPAPGYVSGGSVSMNLNDQTMNLVLNYGFYCTPGTFCSMMMRGPFKLALENVRVSHDNCNATVYEARQDLRSEDGALQVVQVIDNSTNDCKTLVALPASEVIYKTSYLDRESGKIISTNTRLTADALTATLN